ncbi:MAG: hypothetical protein ACK56R_06805, partial [Pirellulaceae bacterium]
TLRIKQQASTAREEEVAWKGWDFVYTYDPTLSAQSNFESINTYVLFHSIGATNHFQTLPPTFLKCHTIGDTHLSNASIARASN